jgi:hypothetical protein
MTNAPSIGPDSIDPATSQASLPTGGYKVGAIALLDALGVKAIWRHFGSAEILDGMARMQEAVDVSLDGIQSVKDQFSATGSFPEHSSRLLFISDSVFLATWPKTAGDPVIDARASVFACALMCKSVIATAAMFATPWSYRGVITCGGFDVHPEENHVVGPAVDEVATHVRDADGAFVWLTPSSYDVYQQGSSSADPLVWHNVPLKQGRRISALVVNPFAGLQPEMQRRLLAGLLAPLPPGSSVDVHIKRQHILEFYRHIVPAPMLREVVAAGRHPGADS